MAQPGRVHPMQVVNHVSARSMMSTTTVVSRSNKNNQLHHSSNAERFHITQMAKKTTTYPRLSDAESFRPKQMTKQITTRSTRTIPPATSSNQLTRNEDGPRGLRDSSKSANQHRKQRQNSHQSSHGFPEVKNFRQIDQLVQAAFDYPNLSPGNMAAIWYRISHLLAARSGELKEHQRQSLSHELGVLVTRTQNRISNYKPRHLCKTAWSIANIIKVVRNYQNSSEALTHHQVLHNVLIRDKSTKKNLFQAIASAAVVHVSRFDSRGHTSMAYACAVAEVCPKTAPGSTLFGCIADAVVCQDLRLFKCEDFSNIAWAFAVRKVSHPRLFEKIADELIACHHLGSFGPQCLSNIVWAYATANVSHRRLFGRAADAIVAYRHLRLFRSQDLSNILWAFATAKVKRPRLFEKVADEIVSRRESELFDSQSLPRVVWAFTIARVPNQIVFEKVADAAIMQKNAFSAEGVANLLWAFSSSGLAQSQTLLFESMAPRVADLLYHCNNQHLASIAWSYAVANVDSPILFSSTFTEILLDKFDAFNCAQLCKIYQWHLWQKEELSSSLSLPLAFEKLCYDAFVSKRLHVSIYHKEVMSTLNALGLDPKEEVLTRKGFRLDASVNVGGNDIGIKVDGSHLFIGQTPVGRATLKRRQVENVEEIRFERIPHFEWRKLRGDCEQQDYLRDLLGRV